MRPTGARGGASPTPTSEVRLAAANFLSALGLIKNLDGQGLSPRFHLSVACSLTSSF